MIPEALDLASAALGTQLVVTTVAVGFVAYMLLDRTIAPHGDKGSRTEKSWRRGALGAGSLSAHSFLDGFAIGLAFKVSAAVGAIVSAAVLAHDFARRAVQVNRQPVCTGWQKRALYSASVIPMTCGNSGLSVRCEVPGGVNVMRESSPSARLISRRIARPSAHRCAPQGCRPRRRARRRSACATACPRAQSGPAPGNRAGRFRFGLARGSAPGLSTA